MSSDQQPKIAKIEIDRELCIGSASCVAIAPGVFELDEENKAIIKDLNTADYAILVEAARSCPTKAIFLYDEAGSQVYPD